MIKILNMKNEHSVSGKDGLSYLCQFSTKNHFPKAQPYNILVIKFPHKIQEWGQLTYRYLKRALKLKR